MSMIKIRKNAFLKIQTILAGSVGVICRSSSSRIDDGYDDEYRVSSCDEALTWLKENHERAQVYLETENGNQMLRISGRYGFETTFMAYFNQAYFDKDLAWYTDRMSKSEPAPSTPPNDKPFLFLVK
ncbi:hypothetical protein [Escherichia coli]|uniref:hypothetical protein n=1 Tax=Escherichia coli TaxID=562 RepID=UPI000E215B19|nr:hypothetical protein [Escherichia coli]MBL7362450.1 hypothetical protein [Escherichia coli]HDK0782508.1 hypothetical protein [Escherichia coli]